VGPFGRDFGWHFAATVLTADLAFGVALALLLRSHITARAGDGVSRVSRLTHGAIHVTRDARAGISSS
jgi:hypothetical protein